MSHVTSGQVKDGPYLCEMTLYIGDLKKSWKACSDLSTQHYQNCTFRGLLI